MSNKDNINPRKTEMGLKMTQMLTLDFCIMTYIIHT